mmetsp:Transcript_12165/g.18385  ORF Transcript_12165/g.18385 Transcript_12165/m.18385 type:complete len:306 (-) Transcript_12165:206-1123(-)|eukprot:CAMPEP_0194088928 /NCGR_PEP_ID=MMETSP0149-20130528/31704_1 /TAXON_ID=122233 /ORGANISM="Chaetoceros debilis, Strain MM31A-1" /LENGTH=305 /DNA_ID=CAMNT_0038772687 /DNA_START=11 /DNA_END=928 /DNA_ORIENTATION=+
MTSTISLFPRSHRWTYQTPFLLFLLLLSHFRHVHVHAQQQDPTTLNGGSILAMSGHNCVAIAVDKRFGSGPQMINVSPRTVLTPHSRAMVGFVGLEGDVLSLAQNLSISISAKMGRHLGFGFSGNGNRNGASKLGRGQEISPKSLSILLSHMMYSRRSSPYYVEPIVAGLEKVVNRELVNSSEIVKDETLIHSEEEFSDEEGVLLSSPCYKERIDYIPFLCAQDVIGAQSKSKAFVCSGTASNSLYGTAEALWRPQLEPEELLQVCGRAFLSALERDCLSGYGAIIYLMVGGEGIMEYELACRND